MNRQEIYQKYNGHCAYCGREIAFRDMQVDHLIPKANGGTDDMDNLMPSCRSCNHYKRAETLESFRRMIETIPVKLGKREYIFKVGMTYGFWNDKKRKVKFYFEG